MDQSVLPPYLILIQLALKESLANLKMMGGEGKAWPPKYYLCF